MNDNITIITENIDLVYSPDDAGYYFDDYANNKGSKDIYESKSGALQAFKAGAVEWEK